MRRIAELQPLSRDHHLALVLANRCKKVSASGDQAACIKLWREVTIEFIHNLLPHFHAEERTLIAPLQRLGEMQLLNKLLEEHGLMQACVFNTQAPEAELLERFGNLLTAHVRFEERELFPLIQDRLDESERQQILRVSESAA